MIFFFKQKTAYEMRISDGSSDVCSSDLPTAFEDLIAIVSLYRPGPMDNIPTYAARKAGLEPLQLPHPALKELLTETQGIPVYQEQIMRMAQILAGYTLGGADMLRSEERSVGKGCVSSCSYRWSPD